MHDKAGLLEKFGIYYIKRFNKRKNLHETEIPADSAIKNYSKRILWISIFLAGCISILCVIPMVWADVHWAQDSFFVHYGYVALFTLGFTLVEFYFLFIIALWAVHKVGMYLNCYAHKENAYMYGPFGIIPILARTALEIQEPVLQDIGINPFKQISKRNLFIIGLFYKLKILLTNTVLKYILLFSFGNQIWGIPILYEAVPVEIFWNAMIIYKVIKESRLRIFGYALANMISQRELQEKTFLQFSPEAKETMLRSIANSVVFAQNYHPNMMVLYFEFKEHFQIEQITHADSWTVFLDKLQVVNINERNAILDILCIASAFDGKFSRVEKDKLDEAFGDHSNIYYSRIEKIKEHLQSGEIHQAFRECEVDFVPG